jgi:hypothetical protein
MNKTFLAVGLIVAVGLCSTTGAAYALSETERYNSGYNHGHTDAKNGVSSYCSTSEHTYTFCQGYNAGYQAVQVRTQHQIGIANATTGNGTSTKICVVNATESCKGKVVATRLLQLGVPEVPPELNINITGNTTMVATPLNATSATNEHDYNIGFKIGYNDYNQSTTDEGLDFGSYVSSNDDVDQCNMHTHAIRWEPHDSWHITNATACRDGYVGGWKSWCKSDGLDCAYWAAYGSVPSLVVLSVKVNHCVQGFCLDRQMLANVYHPPRMSPDVAMIKH